MSSSALSVEDMAHGRNVSAILRALLNSLGLDEDQRQRRMSYQTMDHLLNFFHYKLESSYFSYLPSGSTFETTTIDGLSSDDDKMLIVKSLRVIDDIAEWKVDTWPTFLMDSTGCYRAFTKLYLLSPYYPEILYSDMVLSPMPYFYKVDVNGRFLLSHCVLTSIPNTSVLLGEVHGPAFTLYETTTYLETDCVYTLQCDSFPREAIWWKQRQTPLTRTRIDPAIIDDINHCYLVGVGNKDSRTEHLEWRLSFSHIENKLIHAWNNVQYQCYVLMKFIQKDLIKPFVPDVLCSYHFKTLMMWMNEEYETEFFTGSNFEQCVLTCLKNLAESVRRKSLPHNFVEGCNLFHPKLTKNNDISKKLVAVVEQIVATWPQCLFNISRCNLGRMFRDCCTHQMLLPIICTTVLEKRRQHGYVYELLHEKHNVVNYFYAMRDEVLYNSKPTYMNEVLSNICQMANLFNIKGENKHFLDFAIKDILCNIGLVWIQGNKPVSNKTSLRNMASGLRYIQRYSNSCFVDTGLKIATYFLFNENPRRALNELDRIKDQINTLTFICCHHRHCNKYFTNAFRVQVYDRNPSMAEFCKYYYGMSVTYKPQDMSNVPNGLVFEMFRSTSVSPLSDPRGYDWHSDAVIHCPVYLYYLKFMCHKEQGQDAHQQSALSNMELAAKCTRTHQETNHNIIGHCHRSTGNTTRAYKEYRKSLELEKYNNAVLWHLAVLLRSQIRREH